MFSKDTSLMPDLSLEQSQQISQTSIIIDRSAILALWAAVVSERLGQPKSDRAWNDLAGSFGEYLDDVRDAMKTLADRFSQEELKRRSYELYKQFKPHGRTKCEFDIAEIGTAS